MDPQTIQQLLGKDISLEDIARKQDEIFKSVQDNSRMIMIKNAGFRFLSQKDDDDDEE